VQSAKIEINLLGSNYRLLPQIAILMCGIFST
jgi:hypothetical protein